jgi:hypothetical protein
MTVGHLLFATTATGYILAGIAFEEHDLIQSLGGTYAAYRARVPALIPRLSCGARHAGLSHEKGGKQWRKAVISLGAGMEDPEKVTVAFLVAIGRARRSCQAR